MTITPFVYNVLKQISAAQNFNPKRYDRPGISGKLTLISVDEDEVWTSSVFVVQ